MSAQPWRFWVDRGGTFTDVVARAPDGALHVAKLLSEDPGRYADGASEAMRRLTGTPTGALPAAELRLGTTVATNALLERKGEPTLLAITRGFGDALTIGTQERPDIFARAIVLPPPLHAEVIEIDERVTADGAVLRAPEEAAVRSALRAARARGLRSTAVVLMHGWRFTAHEALVARIAREEGFAHVTASHLAAPLIRIVARGQTSVADAYLTPVLERYVAGLEAAMGPEVRALYMQSNGGLTSGATFRGKDAILSGPAGGIVGMAAIAREAGFEAVVGFDMGGTSTDVSHFAGTYERDGEMRVAGQRIVAPTMRITTVAAGGGSICRFDGARFIVGPQSAGAVPGPACYRRGGPLTVTDCNLLLGRLQADRFPPVFGPDGNQPPDRAASQQRMAEILDQVREAGLPVPTIADAAEGFLAIAVANMANAIKAVSLRRGHDVTRAALVCFGGAAGQLATRVADALGVTRVQCHPLAGVLSAYGMALADRRAVREATVAAPLDDAGMPGIEAAIAGLSDAARSELAGQGLDRESLEIEATLLVRPQGSENTIEIAPDRLGAMRTAFAVRWRERFGFDVEQEAIVQTIRVEAIAAGDVPAGAPFALPARSAPALGTVMLQAEGRAWTAPVHAREGLAEGFAAPGPLLVVDPVSTTVVDPGWSLRVDAIGNLLLSRETRPPAPTTQDIGCDPVRLEIMSALFMAVAEEMGAALQFSASSVNIRERLDFSCAVFDAAGNLVANAPHMPVHLGSMGESVRTILARRGHGGDGRGVRRGDVYALNAPYDGGTHLPDITVVMPVFANEADTAPAWFVAARGHHADIGGISPGSMPPASRMLAEEGVLIDNLLLVEEGRFREVEVMALLASGPWPARDPARNLADLKAQVAACARGAAELGRIAREQGRQTVDAYMAHAQAHAEAAVRDLVGRLSDGSFSVPMDNGARIAVAVTVDRERRALTIDFAGTSDQLADNFNAPLPVVRAAVLYAVRTLLDDAVPMNEGCLRPIEIRVPAGSMLHPCAPAAVVAGNVETSQAITDAVLGALGAMAASQGTMNNFTFGDATRQYYETIAGGAGAGPGFAGASVVQTHMTNSRLTDPEILETAFPVLLEEFSIRHGSGGAGHWRGGDGAVRRLRFLDVMDAGILSNRRLHAPFGLAGGADGAPGINRIERADGTVEALGPTASTRMGPGDVFTILTPGGGGYGPAGR